VFHPRNTACQTQDELQGSSLFRWMNLHSANCQLPPFSSCNMASASDYVSALSIPGDFNWPKAIRTLLLRMNMRLLLPITQMLGRRPAEGDPGGDPLSAVGGSFVINLLFRDALSPLQLYPICVAPSPPPLQLASASLAALGARSLPAHLNVSFSCHIR